MCCFFTLKMVHKRFLCDSVKTTCLEKICFFTYDLRHSPTNQVATFFDHHYLWKQSIDTLRFFTWRHSSAREVSGTMRVPFLVGCLASYASCPFRLQHSLIIISARSQSLPYMFYLNITINRRKDLRLPLLVGHVKFCLLSYQIVILWSSICLEGINRYHKIFAWR